MNQPSAKPKPAAEQHTNRACEACRVHKVRCLPNGSGSSKICQRCARTDRQCVFAPPLKRKQRKRTDTRVAELEREVQAMRALFEKGEGTTESSSGGTQQSSGTVSSTVSGDTPSGGLSSVPFNHPVHSGMDIPAWFTPDDPKASNEQDWAPLPYSPDFDVVDRGILSMEDAKELFQSYKTDLTQHYPAIVFPPELTAEELRATKPTLFLSAIAAASGKVNPHLYSILSSEVISAYAHRTVIRGEKSLELVQAMIITSVWYHPPGRYAQLKFYEYIHMAVTMAIDLGLGKNPKSSRSRRGVQADTEDSLDTFDMAQFEERRTYLICYLIATSVSMSLRRPNTLRCNNWVNECANYVTKFARPEMMDNYLVDWIRLIKITEEIGTSLSFDDTSNMADLSDTRVQMVQKSLEKSMSSWKASVTFESIHDALRIQYYHTQLYLHEIAMHDDHPPEDFLPPFGMEKVLNIHVIPGANNSYINSISVSISSAQALLDVILDMDIEKLRSVPIYTFVRMAYSIITLIKLYISSKTPTSRIGITTDTSSIRLGYYLKSIIGKLVKAVGHIECRAPYTFLGMVMRFHGWYKSQEHNQVFSPPVVPTEMDACWLPPFPKDQWAERFGVVMDDSAPQIDMPDFTYHFDEMSSDLPILETIGHTQLKSDDFEAYINNPISGNEAMDQFMFMGAMDTFNPASQNWMPDMDLSNLNGDLVPGPMIWGSQDTHTTNLPT